MGAPTIGIDPGVTGAIARLDQDEDWNWKGAVFDMPIRTFSTGKKTHREVDEMALRDHLALIFTCLGPLTRVAIEEQGPMPKQGLVSTWTNGGNYATILTVLRLMKLPFVTVKPRQWKKDLAIPAGADKAFSVQMAEDLFPDVELFGPKGGVKDGRADALLIAEWLRRTNGGDDEHK